MRILDCVFLKGPTFIFAVVLSHLRAEQSTLLDQDDFQGIISHLKCVESGMFDADLVITMSTREFASLSTEQLFKMQSNSRNEVQSEFARVQRIRALHVQLERVQHSVAFPELASNMLSFFHQEAENATRKDVAYFLTLVCHTIVWFAEQGIPEEEGGL